MTADPLTKLIKDFRERCKPCLAEKYTYSIPGLWLGKGADPVRVNPCEIVLHALDDIMRRPDKRPKRGGDWTREAVIYNLFVRATCAFDHDRNGELDLPVNREGWRETGTFLKALVMLPYIQSLGTNVIHLLPITAIGSDGNKGNLGSPYAIRNPYRLDDSLCEPKIGLGAEKEFSLFVNAAHRLGMRVVVEFVFRTSSKDSDWITEHPDWFYWIRESVKDRPPGSHDDTQYGNPLFTPEELRGILRAVEGENNSSLPPPHEVYRKMFARPPSKVFMRNRRYVGDSDGIHVRIPGAFADWPPDDTQPPWGDVTYLRLYDHPDFNYIAYNTIRMYDRRLAIKKNINKPLWEKIAEIIPHYQHEFGIDGVMIDMGHALPMDLKHEMIRRARSFDPDFAFWDENFAVTDKSVSEGYNAVIGYQWSDQHHPEKFRAMLRRFSTEGFPVPFFATPESHNTPRAAARDGGLIYSRYAWAVGNFIPAIPFIHSGFEIGEKQPINTGLDFTREELKRYPSERLPLFSASAYDWTVSETLIPWIKRVSELRRRHLALIIDRSPGSFQWIETGSEGTIAFMRHSPAKGKLLICANQNMHAPSDFTIPLGGTGKMRDVLSRRTFSVSGGMLHLSLGPGDVVVIEP